MFMKKEEDEEELVNPEEGGFDDATSTGTKKDYGDQSGVLSVPCLPLNKHLSNFLGANQTIGDTINTLTDVLRQVNSSDQSCMDAVSMGFVPLILQKLDQTAWNTANSSEEVVRLCILITLNLTAVPSCHSVICSQGGMVLLCHWLERGNDETKGYAAVAVGNLATNPSFSAQLGEMGVIGLLIKYIRESKTNAGIEKAVGSLWNLVSNQRENKYRVSSAKGIYPLVTLLKAEISIIQEYAAGTIAKLSSESTLAATLIDHDVIEPLILMLVTGNDMRKQHACLAIRNLAVKSKAKRMIAVANGIDPLIHLLSTGTRRCQLDAVAALGNLATTSQNRTLIGNKNGIYPLVNLLKDEEYNDLRPKICSALKFLSHNMKNIKSIGNAGAIPILMTLLKNNDNRVQLKTKEDIVECLSNLVLNMYEDVNVGTMIWDTFFMVDRTKIMIDGGIIQLLMDHLAGRVDTTEKIVECSMIMLCNLCSSKDVRSTIIETGGVELLSRMISRGSNSKTLINCAGILGNLARQDQASVDAIVRNGAVVYILRLLGCENAPNTKHRFLQEEKDILAAALWNICSVNEEARQCLITDGPEIVTRLVEKFPSSDRIYRLQKILVERPVVEY